MCTITHAIETRPYFNRRGLEARLGPANRSASDKWLGTCLYRICCNTVYILITAPHHKKTILHLVLIVKKELNFKVGALLQKSEFDTF